MVDINDDEFHQLIDKALSQLPAEHVKNIKNVAILFDNEPSPRQRQELKLRHDQTLLGLYEGVPLSQRQGNTRVLPDKITLFKGPLTRQSFDRLSLQENIKHTLWHEVAHYYGLDHDQIRKLE